LLNNPPKKDTLLKGSKDGDREGPQRFTKPGEFGFLNSLKKDGTDKLSGGTNTVLS